MAAPTWVLDSSSLIAVRLLRKELRPEIYAGMAALVEAGRLRFPSEVVKELKRYAGPENPALDWAQAQAGTAHRQEPDLSMVKSVLAVVPEVLDPDKDGAEEADPYVIAHALAIRDAVPDVRVITEDVKATGAKMALSTAAGILGLPSVSLRGFLKFEGIAEWDAL